MAPATQTLTYTQWLQLPETHAVREECVAGRIEQMPPAKWTHTVVVERLARQLWKMLDETEAIVVSSSFGLVIRTDPMTQRSPDLAVFRLATLVERDIHSAPELAVEVLSPSNTPARLRAALADYAEIGVPEVWIVDPAERRVEVGQSTPLGYSMKPVADGAIVPVAAFPAVAVDFSFVWR
jgi:Uma2 family endonuclease